MIENKPIQMFRYEYFFLSNFYQCEITIDDITYKSAEAAFQAQKTLSEEERKKFVDMEPKRAKAYGKRVKLRDDWEDIKLGIMENVIRQKFTQNEYLRNKLIETGDRPLCELNTWNDTFWGVSAKTGKGENHLGKILMKIRKEFQDNEGYL